MLAVTPYPEKESKFKSSAQVRSEGGPCLVFYKFFLSKHIYCTKLEPIPKIASGILAESYFNKTKGPRVYYLDLLSQDDALADGLFVLSG